MPSTQRGHPDQLARTRARVATKTYYHWRRGGRARSVTGVIRLHQGQANAERRRRGASDGSGCCVVGVSDRGSRSIRREPGSRCLGIRTQPQRRGASVCLDSSLRVHLPLGGLLVAVYARPLLFLSLCLTLGSLSPLVVCPAHAHKHIGGLHKPRTQIHVRAHTFTQAHTH